MPQYDVDLREYWRILKKRKAIVIIMVFLAGLSSYGFAKLKEPTPLYEANSAIKIERINTMADFFMGGFWYQGENLDTHAYIITSFPVLVQTAKVLGRLPKNLVTKEIRNSKTFLSEIQRLKSIITAQREAGTNIINIRVISKNPHESAQVANALTTAYRDYNIQEKNRKTFETKAFIEEQLRLTSDNLKFAEEKLKAFKEGYALISMDSQTKNIIDRLFAVEAKYEEVKRQKNEVASQLKSMEEKIKGFPENLERTLFSPAKDSPAFKLRGKLSDLFLKRQTLLIDFTEKHPQVVEIDDQIQAVIIETEKELNAYYKTLESREADLSKKLNQLKKENQRLPEKALQLVRLQRELNLQESLYSQLKTKYQETLIQESGKVEEVTIVKPAIVPTHPINIPSSVMIVVTGVIMGLILGFVFVFVVETLDTSIGTIEDVESLLGVPVLGAIPFFEKDEKGQVYSIRNLVTHFDPTSIIAEAFRSLRTNIRFMGLEKKGKTFLVTSSFVQEGKTFSIVNLALSIAQAGDKVLLVEGDLRKPMINKMFGLPKDPGLTDYVLGNYQWKEIIVSITDLILGDFEFEDIMKTPGLENLNIMVGGSLPPNPSEILRSPRFNEFLKEACKDYNYIFIDAPPILPVADATEIAPIVDSVILVYKVGQIARGVVKRAKASLDNVNAKVLGVILNSIKPEIGPDYFKYHTQYYYGPSKKVGHTKGSIFDNLVQSMEGPILQSTFFKLMMLLMAVTLLIFGIFWKDLYPLLFP